MKDTPEEVLGDNRWHYLEYRDGKHDGHYVEWKYFNFVSDNLAGYIIYYVLDPEQHTPIGGGRLLARVFGDGVSLGTLSQISMDRVQFDATSAGISLDGATITETSPHTYELAGASGDLSWNLTFTQKDPSIHSFVDLNPGLLSWETVNWIVKMPKARVTGHLSLAGKQVAVEALGYSDTNWGELMPFSSRYEWGQLSGRDHSFVFGLVYGLWGIKHAYCYLSLEGEHIALEEAACTSTHHAWTRAAGIKIPSETHLSFKKGDYTVHLTTRLLTHDTLGLKISRFLPKPVVSEQIVEYHAVVTKKGVPLATFSGKGFKEWSTKTWRTVPIEF